MGLFGQDKPQSANVTGTDQRLRCEICKNETFWYRHAQLHTAVASFFNFEWAQPTADCYVCARCGYIHWFLPPSE